MKKKVLAKKYPWWAKYLTIACVGERDMVTTPIISFVIGLLAYMGPIGVIVKLSSLGLIPEIIAGVLIIVFFPLMMLGWGQMWAVVALLKYGKDYDYYVLYFDKGTLQHEFKHLVEGHAEMSLWKRMQVIPMFEIRAFFRSAMTGGEDYGIRPEDYYEVTYA